MTKSLRCYTATDRPGAPPKEGRDSLTPYLKRAEAAGMDVVFAPLEEVAELCVEGIRKDTFWITVPNADTAGRIEARAASQIGQTPPDYLVADNLMTGRKLGRED